MKSIGDDSRDYNFEDIEVEERFKRCEYEMRLTYGLWISYAIISIGLSYYLGRGWTENMIYVYGIPSWFFWGIVVTTALFFCIVCFVCTFVYKDMDLFDTPVKN